MMSLYNILCLLLICNLKFSLSSECLKDEFNYVYTACDINNNRWRVAIPINNCTVGSYVPSPQVAKRCDFVCKAGTYLNINNDLCDLCDAGSYSLGGGIRYDLWENNLPPQFLPLGNCSRGWNVKDGFLIGNASDCTSLLLKYEVEILHHGNISFSYSYSDPTLLAGFQVENGNCNDDIMKNKFLHSTEEDEFKTYKQNLLPGNNIIYFSLFDPTGVTHHKSDSNHKKLLRIQSVEIFGKSFSSECMPCNPGSYSAKGASTCALCPPNTFSNKGATECTNCKKDEYSDQGSSKCIKKPLCTENDYFTYYAPCTNERTKLMTKWTEPHICTVEKIGAVKLPDAGPFIPCPACNLGMQLNEEGHCSFCPPNTYANADTKGCISCPPNTHAMPLISISSWNNLPKNFNLTTSCLSSDDDDVECITQDGWFAATNEYMETRGVNDPATYQSLSIRVPGFIINKVKHRSSHKNVDDEIRASIVGSVSFIFELDCKADCSLYFTKKTGKSLEIVKQWTGPQSKTLYKYNVQTSQSATFSLTFQQSEETSPVFRFDGSSSKDELDVVQSIKNKDVARLYAINITNVLVGGAAECTECPLSSNHQGCLNCPIGNYINEITKKCEICVNNTYVQGLNEVGASSCLPCGSGLYHYNHVQCINNCSYNSSNGKAYNFSALAGIRTIKSPYLFTSSGYKYFHLFNISLCSDNRQINNKPLATCQNNVTIEDGEEEQEDVVVLKEAICRMTLLPSGNENSISTNPISFSQELLGVTDNVELFGIRTHLAKASIPPPSTILNDVYFVYKTNTTSKVCPNGRMGIVVLRCDESVTEDGGTISLPAGCPDGTCDGCNFIILLRAKAACPICTSKDLYEYKQDCKDGKQQIITKVISGHFCYNGATTSETKIVSCSMFWNNSWPLWFKFLLILIPVFIFSGIILLAVTCYCWMKNKNLQYKYMKLIASTGYGGLEGEGEMEGVDSCALDEGEEDEHFDALQFKNKTSFFRKNDKKNFRKFDGIDLDEKATLT